MSGRQDPGRGGGERGGRGGDERGGRGGNARGGNDERRNDRGRTRNRGTSGGPRQFSAAAPSQRRRSADPARLAAFETLTAVSRDDAYANLVLPARIAAHRLDRRDAGFATELAYGALRGQGLYDAVLGTCVDRPLDRLDPPVLDALRLGAHQLLGMRVPAHAALDATVALVRDQVGAGPSGLVNAVLRKVSAQDRETWLGQLAPAAGGDDALAIRHSHPRWIVRALRQSLANHGRPAEELEALLQADNAAPVVNLVALPGLGELGPVLEAGAEPGPLAPGSALYHGGDAGRLQGVREGTVRVQDVGSQLTARALAEAPVAPRSPRGDGTRAGAAPDGVTQDGVAQDGGSRRGEPSERWLDLCAGPGGKAALLAALARQRGATLLANEPAEHRARLVEQALSAVPGDTWTVRCGDGRDLGPEVAAGQRESFDRILVDAPCTGLGALRRRPESRWRRQPSDLGPLTELQRQLLDSAVAALRPGGVLGYVTCSPHPAETVLQVQDVQKRHPGLELLDTTGCLVRAATGSGGEDAGTPDAGTPGAGTGGHDAADGLRGAGTAGSPGTSQLWPHLHATDAMFMALFRKAGSGDVGTSAERTTEP